MHAASRSALKACNDHLNTVVTGESTSIVAAHVGTELFDCVEILDDNRSLRVAVAESSTSGEQRAQLVRDVFGGKISDTTLDCLTFAASQNWSNPREMREGLVEIARRSLLKKAQAESQLDQVQDQLFRLSRILEREGELTQKLSDRTVEPSRRRSLLAAVLYGKVLAVTEALALQAIGRPTKGPVDDIADLATLAAALEGKTIAHVATAAPLSDEQERTLTDKLGRIYGQNMIIHSEVDASLLGGMVIRVGDEVIDGSTVGRINRLRAQMA